MDVYVTSGYKGVYHHKGKSRWSATAKNNGKQVHLGTFHNPIDAAIAYNWAALKFYGSFARLNEVY